MQQMWNVVLTALVLAIAAPQVALGAPCDVELKLAYKHSDIAQGQEMCQVAVEHMSQYELGFECTAVTTMEVVEGFAAPTFGGIHAYNDFFGNIVVTAKGVLSKDVHAFYMKFHKNGGLYALSNAIKFPVVWRSSCCSDPALTMTDTCEIDSFVDGDWAPGCRSCAELV
eukprot:gene26795-4385_t